VVQWVRLARLGQMVLLVQLDRLLRPPRQRRSLPWLRLGQAIQWGLVALQLPWHRLDLRRQLDRRGQLRLQDR